MTPRRSCSTVTPLKLNVNVKTSPYHDGVGEVTISLALQPHSAELSSHVAIGSGFIKGGLPYTSHFGGHEEGQHALEGRKGNKNIKVTNQEFTYVRFSFSSLKVNEATWGESWRLQVQTSTTRWRLIPAEVGSPQLPQERRRFYEIGSKSKVWILRWSSGIMEVALWSGINLQLT